MTTTREKMPKGGELDVSTCDREPIRIPGSIQPHGMLFVLDRPGGLIQAASLNTDEFIGKPAEDLIGRAIRDVLGADTWRRMEPGIDKLVDGGGPSKVGTLSLGAWRREAPFHVVAHRSGTHVLLELEPAGDGGEANLVDVYPLLQSFLTKIEAATTVEDLARLASLEVRRLVGFDRVLIYRFDEDEHGTVIGEDGNGRLPSYLGHRFPASDIPRQARDLYRLNRLRLIPDASYEPVPILGPVGPPLDLSFSTLRSVSPIHVEYMRNMGTAASMSISIVRENRLWGLICCHHATPRHVPFELRASCDFLGQFFPMQLAHKEHQARFEHRLRLTSIESTLVASLTLHDDFVSGLAEHASDLLTFADAAGVAVLYEGSCTLLARTPEEKDVRALADWLAKDIRQEVFATDSLANDLPWAESIKDTASGVLAVSISKLHSNYLIWFRPELPTTVTWAGDPTKPTADIEDGPATLGGLRLRPRTSFAAWVEHVRLRSTPWREADTTGAAALRNAIVGVVLKKAERMAELNAELERSNQELEAFSYSVSHDLRAPFRHIVGYAELLKDIEADALSPAGKRYLETIIESAQYSGTLVDNLLAFSRMGRTSILPVAVDMQVLVEESIAMASKEADGRDVEWKVGELPPARGDLMMLRLAVINLLSNALKYTRPRARAVIEVWGEPDGRENIYTVRDNGIGFDMKYSDKLFGVFQRLHRMEDFEGTGIGLANVRRIVGRHGGRAWAVGALDVGATFSFSLPKGGTSG